MLVILTGAKKNIGDFLIGERAKTLLKEFLDDDIIELDRFKKLDDQLELINKSKALVLCGGPAYSRDIYKGIYPLVDDLNNIKVPIVPFGLGWSGKPFNKANNFRFNKDSEIFLSHIHKTLEKSSCRDEITMGILKANGIDNVVMTGCPVWYDMDFIGKAFKMPITPKQVVFSTGASSNLFFQSVSLLKSLKRHFPKAKIHITYHRGIFPAKGTPPRKGLSYMAIAFYGLLSGSKIHDVSSDLKKINFYQNCDLHIGYRVHAHLYFLSKRIPSILINEDGRGLGMVRSMNLPELNYNDRNLLSKMDRLFTHYKETNFSDFQKIQKYIDAKFEIMKSFLTNLKNDN